MKVREPLKKKHRIFTFFNLLVYISLFNISSPIAFVPGFKKDVSIRTTLPPGDLPTNTWSPINQQFAYRLSNNNRPGTVIKYHKPVITSKSITQAAKKEPPRFNQTQQQRQVKKKN